MVDPELPEAAAAVGHAGEGREVAVQVNVLSVATATGPSVKYGTLDISQSSSQGRKLDYTAPQK